MSIANTSTSFLKIYVNKEIVYLFILCQIYIITFYLMFIINCILDWSSTCILINVISYISNKEYNFKDRIVAIVSFKI